MQFIGLGISNWKNACYISSAVHTVVLAVVFRIACPLATLELIVASAAAAFLVFPGVLLNIPARLDPLLVPGSFMDTNLVSVLAHTVVYFFVMLAILMVTEDAGGKSAVKAKSKK